MSNKATTSKTANQSSHPSSEQIAALAYKFYEESGREDGHAMEHWLRAERELALNGQTVTSDQRQSQSRGQNQRNNIRPVESQRLAA